LTPGSGIGKKSLMWIRDGKISDTEWLKVRSGMEKSRIRDKKSWIRNTGGSVADPEDDPDLYFRTTDPYPDSDLDPYYLSKIQRNQKKRFNIYKTIK
jgi:hypothetical protein